MKNKVKKQVRKVTKARIVPLHTKRKRAEKALQRAAKHWQTTFDGITDAVCLLDNDAKIVQCNQATSRMFEKAHDQIIGRNCCEIVHGSPKPLDGCPLVRMRSSLKREEMELSVGEKWFQVTVDPLTDDDGNLTGAVHIVSDITERKKAEEALRKSEKQASAAIEAAKGITFNYDIATGKIEWGGTIKEIIEYTPKEFAQVDVDGWAEMIHPDDKDRVLSILQEAIQKKDRATAEYRFRTKKGGYVILSSISLTEKKDGKAVRLVGILQDITKRKRAEEELRESRDYLESLTNSMWDAVFSVKMPERVIEWANDSFELIGYGPEECIGRTTEFLYPDRTEFLDFGNKLASAIVAGKDILHTEQLLKRKNGEVFPAEITVTAYKEKGKVVSVTSIVRDITERKKAEEALKTAKEFSENLVETANTLVITLNSESGITTFNRCAEELTGYKKAEVIGRNWFDLFILQRDKETIPKVFKEALKNMPEVSQYENPIVTKSGEERLISWSNNVLRDSCGNINGVLSIGMDITERKKAEAELENIFNLSPDMVCVCTPEGKLLKVSPSCQRVLGYTQEEILKLGWAKLVHPDDVEPTNKEVIKQLKGTSVANFVNRYKHKDGSYRILEWQATPSINGIVYATARDITERKQAEEELRESEGRLNSFLKSATEGFVLYDSDLKLVMLNKAALNIFPPDTKEEDLIGKHILEINPGLKKTGRCDKYWHVLKTGKPFFSDDIVPHPKFGDIHLSLNAFKVGDGLGFAFTDVTERKKAEKERENLAKFPSENPNPVLRITKDGQVLYSNEAGKPLLAKWKCGAGKTVPAKWRSIIAQAFASGKGKEEVKGKIFSITIAPVKEAGYANLYAIDITERKRTEEEIELFAKTLAEKNKELESIMNITAHDLRTPLVNIKGFGDLLQNNLQHLRSIVNKSKVPDNLKNELETIFTGDIYQNLKFIKIGTEMLDSLLKALLRLARLGRAAVDFQKLNMNEMISDIAGSVKYHLDKKNVKLTIKPLPHCYGDKVMVAEVFLNLLGNAVKYLDPSRPAVITLSGSKKKDRIVYCVRDNGFGIDPELQKHVFDIFYRIRHGEQHVDGEGMGLTIVRRIMDFHDGKVWLESEKGIGSKFYVSFPAAEKRLPKRILEIKKGIVPEGTIPRKESYR